VASDGPALLPKLIFGSHFQLRALAEVYDGADAQKKFAHDFGAV
jgi:catalase-peroxidase